MAENSSPSRSCTGQSGIEVRRNSSCAPPPPNKATWPLSRSRCGGLRPAQDAVGIFHHLAAVGVEAVEGAGPHQIFEGALVDQPRIDAAGEIATAILNWPPSSRTSTTWSIAWRPTPFTAASA